MKIDKALVSGFTKINDKWYKNNRYFLEKICLSCNANYVSITKSSKYCDTTCANTIINNLNKVEIDIVKERLDKLNYNFVRIEYNPHCYIFFVCDKGHEHKMSLGNLTKGQRCGMCTVNITGYTYKEVKK